MGIKSRVEARSGKGSAYGKNQPVAQGNCLTQQKRRGSEERFFLTARTRLSSKITESPRMLAQKKQLGRIFGTQNRGFGGSASATNFPIQRDLDIGDYGYLDSEDPDLTMENASSDLKSALNKNNYKDHKIDLLKVLNQWKNDDDFDTEFQHWAAALYQAKQTLDIEVPEEVVLEHLDIPKKPGDAADTRTLYFTAEGEFSSDTGEKLSGGAVNMLIQSLVLTHVYSGHGPALTDEALRSKCLTEGVSGKWETDFDAMKAVAEVYRLIGTGGIVPSAGFKMFDTAGINSVNYRKRTKDAVDHAYTTPASKAKCGFKKHTGEGGDYYTLKTVFPYPETVNDDGIAGGY